MGAHFDSGLELAQGVVPLLSDGFERAAGFVEARRFKLPEPLAADLHVAHKTGVGKHLQMLRDGLARDVRTGGQPGDGERAARAQGRDQSEARGISQRGEDRGSVPEG